MWAYTDGPTAAWSEMFGVNSGDNMRTLLYDSGNDKIYVGGLDDDATGYNLFRLTASDGSGEIGRDVGGMGIVLSIAQKADDALIIGGYDSSSHGLFEVAADLSSETAIGTNALRAYDVMVASDGKIYAARELGTLEKWSDGEYVTPDWTVDLSASHISYLNELSNGNIVCGDLADADSVFCRSVAAGAEVWTNSTTVTSGGITAIFVDSNNDVYVFWNYQVSKLNPATGVEVWTENIAKYVLSVTETGAGILALTGEISSGTTAWTFDQSTKTLTSLEITHDGAFPYMYGSSGQLVASAPQDYDEGTLSISGSGTVDLSTESYRDLSGWPYPKASDYDPDKYFDQATETWVTTENKEGGRYKTQLVAIGQNDTGDGVIYYGGM